MPEDRTALVLEVLAALRVLDDDVRPDDVARHEVGRELDTREGEIEALRQRLDQQRLAEPRHTFEQDVAPGEQPDQDMVDDLVVTDDDLANLGAE